MPPTPRVHIEPPMQTWRVTPRNGRTKPVIATGHQPALWHPGILAKDIAAAAFAHTLGGDAFHVVVEHNPLGPLSLDVPTRRGEALGTRRITLDPRAAADTTPPNRLPPIDTGHAADLLSDAAAASDDAPAIHDRLPHIARAYAAQPDHPHLAAQTTAVLAELKRPYLPADMHVLPTSALVTPGFVDRLLADPVGCVRCYNRAARAFPEAGIRPLYAGRDVVEAPLWAQADGPSLPVYIDLGDSKRPLLFTHAPPIDLAGPDAVGLLRPRAITLSALVRSEHCDLFIHGSGGGVYDRVTERWWRDWAGEALAPMAVVSADLYLPFDAPTATRDQLQHAVWLDHHLPHNIDRYTGPQDDAEAALAIEKHRLLDHMHDDRDKRRRAKSFQRIHAINDQLAKLHHDKLAAARLAVNAARIGVSNRGVIERRDWCFALYEPDALQWLGQAHMDIE